MIADLATRFTREKASGVKDKKERAAKHKLADECYKFSGQYHTGVVVLGWDAYKEDQQVYCKCCP